MKRKCEYQLLKYAIKKTTRLKRERLWHTYMSCMLHKGQMYNHECIHQHKNMCTDIPMLTGKLV